MSGRVRESEKQEREIEREMERERERDGEEVVRGKGKEREGRQGSELVTSPVSRQHQRSPLSPLSALDKESERQERETTQTALGTIERMTAEFTTVPQVAVPASGRSTAPSPPVRSSLLSAASSPAPVRLSTSPNRGPMLTNKDDVEERLKWMNETFMKSLEGMGKGGSVRRRDKEREIERDATTRRGLSLLVSPTEGEATTTTNPSSTSDSGDARTTKASPYRGQTGEQQQYPNPTRIPSPTSSRGTSRSNRPGAVLHPQTGLGLGLGRGRGGLVGSATSTTSTSGSSEALGGASQGSEEVIGRMDLYDEMGRRPSGF